MFSSCLSDDGGGGGNNEREEENNFRSSYVSGILLSALLTFSNLLNKESKFQNGKQLSQDQSVKPKSKPRIPTLGVVCAPLYNAGWLYENHFRHFKLKIFNINL